MNEIAIRPQDIRELEDVRRAVKELFKDKSVEVYIFGSRAKGDHTPRSDLDLGFLSEENIGYELALLRELLEESNLTFSVDVVDLSKTSEEFREAVLREGRVWIY